MVQIPSGIEHGIHAIAADRLSGATSLVLSGVKLLRTVAGEAALLREVANRLVAAQPLMAGFRTAAAIATTSVEPARELEALAQRISRAPDTIARIAVPLIQLRRDQGRPLAIVTCSRSQVVERTLLALAQADLLHVRCAESRPGREGAALAEALARRGIHVDLFDDAAIGAAIPTSDALVVGADAVSSDGFINKVGTAGLAALARVHGVASFVMTGAERVVTAEVFRALPLAAPPLTPAHADKAQLPRVVREVLFERIPAALVDQLITETGLQLFDDI
ncbi:MAG: hypothetical protein ACRD1U_06855 [Vicinamibacterales bacterium]